MKTIFCSIYGFLTRQVRIKDLTHVKILGKIYPLVLISTSGASDGFKTEYTIERNGEFMSFEERDIEEFILTYVWVHKDSLAGILSLVKYP